MSDSLPQPIRVVFTLLPGSLVLDWAGPAEALRIANQRLAARGEMERFVIEFTGPDAAAEGSVGVRLADLAPLPVLNGETPTWVVVPGLAGHPIDLESAAMHALLHWMRGLRPVEGRLELVTICAGALVAARAGHLAGRRATTHHQHLEDLRAAEPRCDVQANRVFVSDGPVHSSAGVTTGLDLMLELISRVCGSALAAQVAQTMVVALRRGAHDPALSPFLHHRSHLHAALHRVQDAVSQQPAAEWTVPGMARLAHVTPRHLARLFLEHAGIAPLQYLRRIRLATAEAALRSGSNVTQAALLAGFGSDTQLRRAWRHFGLEGTPSEPD